GCFQAAVSVEQFEADILLLSPNPVETTLKIHISDPAVLGGQLFITDIHGGVRWQGAMNEDVVILDFTNYTPGVYIAHYITKNKKASKKIIKI
ncbi:T9SS type A sorting domain-containing protein, partial [Bacteroidales bacterium OttesenSCG-928-E04]|nr:T9SS type A sorting domain-containing protein [Bacteroidales bacterium OttesenSCG-928-E04]